MRNHDDSSDDLWQDFVTDTETKAAKNRPVTDGSQWVGAYDRRSTPRDDAPQNTPDQGQAEK